MFRFLLVAALAALSVLPAHAQGTVPPQLLDTTRPVGNVIRFCLDTLSPGADFDRDVAQAVADAALLEAQFVEAPGGFPLDAAGYLDELRLAMNNTCEVLPGISLQPGLAVPEWASVTRPYADVPFVLVVTNPAYRRLGDVPHDRRIGTAIGGVGERAVIAYMEAVRPEQRWTRLPYADPELMLRRLRDGTIDAMVLWQPVLARIAPDAPDLRIIPADPVPETSVPVGMLVTARDQFLRTLIDDTIAALAADGTLAALMEKHGYLGTPGPQ